MCCCIPCTSWHLSANNHTFSCILIGAFVLTWWPVPGYVFGHKRACQWCANLKTENARILHDIIYSSCGASLSPVCGKLQLLDEWPDSPGLTWSLLRRLVPFILWNNNPRLVFSMSKFSRRSNVQGCTFSMLGLFVADSLKATVAHNTGQVLQSNVGVTILHPPTVMLLLLINIWYDLHGK